MVGRLKELSPDERAAALAKIEETTPDAVMNVGITYYTGLVDTVAHIVLAQAGLDVSGETVAYIAGWGEDGALEAIRAHAQTVDGVARRIERAILPEQPPATDR